MARLAGSRTSSLSKPGISVGPTNTILSPVISVVPIRMEIAVLATARTPVSLNSSTVATLVPVESRVVTLNGSPTQPILNEFVMLQAMARPPGPLAVVKRSGCVATITNVPRIVVPVPAVSL